MTPTAAPASAIHGPAANAPAGLRPSSTTVRPIAQTTTKAPRW